MALKVEGVQVERDIPLRGYEITVLLSTEGEEGTYTFFVSDQEWREATARGQDRTGVEAIGEPFPWLIVGKKEAAPCP